MPKYTMRQEVQTVKMWPMVAEIRCAVPECRGISHADPTFREALWDRYFTAAQDHAFTPGDRILPAAVVARWPWDGRGVIRMQAQTDIGRHRYRRGDDRHC